MANRMHLLTGLFISSLLFCANAQCPLPFREINGYEGFCYFHISTPLAWNAADSVCQYYEGGDLTSIDEPEEGMAIYRYWNELTDRRADMGYWIGLSDIHNNGFGQRKWSDWTSIQGKTNWQAGQPSTNTSEDCVHVANEGAEEGDRVQWKATFCGDARPFICERKMIIN